MERARLIHALGTEKATEEFCQHRTLWWVQSTLQTVLNLQGICSRLLLANWQVFLIITSLKGPDIELHFTVRGLRGNKGLVLRVLQALFLSRYTQERERVRYGA